MIMSTSANLTLQRVNEKQGLRGFANLFRKENRAWWGTRRWWVNALLWPALLGGLVFMMLFMLPPVAEATGDPNVAAMGGPIPFALEMGRTAFFELGTMALAVGAIILCQDLIIDEKQSGVVDWLLSKPVTRRSYILAKLSATLIATLALMITLPGLIVYGLFFLRTGQAFPLIPYMSGVGIMGLHMFFYLTLTIMAGAFFTNRPPILALTLGSLLGGSILGGFAEFLLYVTPWTLAKIASATAAGMSLPQEMQVYPLVATGIWCVIFVLLTIWEFDRAEF
jgi:ABC-type transport system involved in multi-copper enzyme maturation permease subunit